MNSVVLAKDAFFDLPSQNKKVKVNEKSLWLGSIEFKTLDICET